MPDLFVMPDPDRASFHLGQNAAYMISNWYICQLGNISYICNKYNI